MTRGIKGSGKKVRQAKPVAKSTAGTAKKRVQAKQPKQASSPAVDRMVERAARAVALDLFTAALNGKRITGRLLKETVSKYVAEASKSSKKSKKVAKSVKTTSAKTSRKARKEAKVSKAVTPPKEAPEVLQAVPVTVTSASSQEKTKRTRKSKSVTENKSAAMEINKAEQVTPAIDKANKNVKTAITNVTVTKAIN